MGGSAYPSLPRALSTSASPMWSRVWSSYLPLQEESFGSRWVLMHGLSRTETSKTLYFAYLSTPSHTIEIISRKKLSLTITRRYVSRQQKRPLVSSPIMVEDRPLRLVLTCEEDTASKSRHLGFRLSYNNGAALSAGEECSLFAAVTCQVGEYWVGAGPQSWLGTCTFRGDMVDVCEARYWSCEVRIWVIRG
jgi:hypothetical protein